MSSREGLKKFCGTWYNYIAQQDQSEIIWAKDEREAVIAMTAMMRYKCGSHYSENEIESLYEMTDDSGFALEDIKEKYIKDGKEWIYDDYQISENCAYGQEE